MLLWLLRLSSGAACTEKVLARFHVSASWVWFDITGHSSSHGHTREFRDTASLTRHLVSHADVRPFVCSFAGCSKVHATVVRM